MFAAASLVIEICTAPMAYTLALLGAVDYQRDFKRQRIVCGFDKIYLAAVYRNGIVLGLIFRDNGINFRFKRNGNLVKATVAFGLLKPAYGHFKADNVRGILHFSNNGNIGKLRLFGRHRNGEIKSFGHSRTLKK